MNRVYCLALLLCGCTHALRGASATGVYFVFASQAMTRVYTAEGEVRLPTAASSGRLELFASLYRENSFELSLSVGRDRYRPEEAGDPQTRYQVGFAAGKLVSIPVDSRGTRFVCADFGGGLFCRFHLPGAAGAAARDLSSDWGLYGVFKLRLQFLRRLLRSGSVDLGYRFLSPVQTGGAGATATLTGIHAFFFGASF